MATTSLLSIIFPALMAVLVGEVTTVSTPATTPPTTPPPILTRFSSTYSGASHRDGKKLDAKPMVVVNVANKVQCISQCLQRMRGPKKNRCKAVNYGHDGSCQILNTYVCDGDKNLTVAPGYTYFDMVDNHDDDVSTCHEVENNSQIHTHHWCRNLEAEVF